MHIHSSLPTTLLLLLTLNPITASKLPPTENTNHIFNAIHSSTRQWGSSLNHNGMSFFMATVPAGTQLYHGTSSAELVKGMEWLAFEAEHALVFARPAWRGGERPHGRLRYEEQLSLSASNDFHEHQSPLYPTSPFAPSGYLHTYTPMHSLTLLYIDGLSAGKTSKGTLDTQDFLLLNLTLHDRRGPMGGEFVRARRLCELASTLWQGQIDGVMRMEGGFEVILCDFEKSVERVDVMPPRVREQKGERRTLGGWEYVQAVASRYHGVGGGRVSLDYERFVSCFEYEGLHLWANDVVSDTPHPRLTNASPEQFKEIKSAVTDMILRSGERKHGRNWQEVADMVVTRYSAPLHHLRTDEEVRGSREAFASYLSTLLRPFIAAGERNSTMELQRCILQFVPRLAVPPSSSPSLAHMTIHTITSKICSTLISTFDTTNSSISGLSVPASPPPSHVLDLVDSLVDHLQWTTWKECGKCADEEVCIIPIWPTGSAENHKTPKCGGLEDVGGGYWGRYEPTGEPRAGDGGPSEGGESQG
jgi:hypothetical protein